MAILDLWNNVWPYLVAILVFLIVIIIHEFGHFITAKLNGVKVNEFAVGFGPALLKKRIGETTYSLRLIPFGGFCSMEGEDEDSQDPRAFGNKKPWRRFLIVAAGAIFNLILGFVLCLSFVASRELYATTTISKFDESAVSQNYGLEVGDTIVKANGRKVYTFNDLSYMFGTSRDGVIDFVVERDGKKVNVDNVKFNLEKLKDGNQYIKRDFFVYGEKRTFFSVIKNAAKTEISLGRMVIMSVYDMICGRFGISDMSGPVGITVAIGDAARQSMSMLVYICALITINLGIFNLMPLPALDGGRLLFILIELVRRKPIPAKYEGVVHTIGFVLLMLFAVFVMINDIIKLI